MQCANTLEASSVNKELARVHTELRMVWSCLSMKPDLLVFSISNMKLKSHNVIKHNICNNLLFDTSNYIYMHAFV